ncbi:MAG: zinc-dependent metalloprotease, partial [Mycobacteriales bacterium]
MPALVDWRYAQSTATLLGKTGPSASPAHAREAVRSLRVLAAEAGEHVTAVTGLGAGVPLAPARVVDRHDWVAINAAGFGAVIEPALARSFPAAARGPLIRSVTTAATGIQLGAAMALVSSRVLGQYELFATTGGQLLLVAPNIMLAEQKLGVDPHDFRLWVCLHEVTHQLQFTAVPWLRGYFLSELEALLAIKSPLELLRSATARQKLSAMTALMTLVEGHAEYVMDAVGPQVVSYVAVIRKKFDA